MCGRIACTLAPDVICRACTYKDGRSGQFQQPTWQDHPSSDDNTSSYTYYPSANIPPTRFAPVMYKSSEHEKKTDGQSKNSETEAERIVITPMMFGLIPFYHKGEAKSHGLSTNNARIEGILDSRLYTPVLNKRKLCVIVAQGFYEWKSVSASSKLKKQPYLIFPQQQDENVKVVADDSSWVNATWSKEEGWSGPKILKMAGLYDKWTSPKGEIVYSFTVITMGSNKTLSWLHDRMPAILETEEQLMGWLNASPESSTKELLSILKPATHLQWYSVDPKVGNSRCRDIDCMQPEDKKDSKGSNFMDNWLKKPDNKLEKRKNDDDDDDKKDVTPAQIPKVEK